MEIVVCVGGREQGGREGPGVRCVQPLVPAIPLMGEIQVHQQQLSSKTAVSSQSSFIRKQFHPKSIPIEQCGGEGHEEKIFR